MECIRWLKGKKVLLLYNEPGLFASESEMGVLNEVEAVCGALQLLGIEYEVRGIRGLEEVKDVLKGAKGLVFNLVESFKEDPLSYCLIPHICESMGWAVTGSSTPSLLKTTDKTLCKAILKANNIPTPMWELINNGSGLKRLKETKAIIVKPVAYHGSEGIDGQKNLIFAPFKEEGLIKLTRELNERFKYGVMAEEFVGDREINATVLEKDGVIEVMELAEIDFSGLAHVYPKIVDYKAKWDESSLIYRLTPRIIPAPLSDGISKQIKQMAADCFKLFGCHDYIRIDFRLEGEKIYVIDVNTNPDVSLNGGLANTIYSSGVEYTTFILQVLQNALRRAAQSSLVCV